MAVLHQYHMHGDDFYEHGMDEHKKPSEVFAVLMITETIFPFRNHIQMRGKSIADGCVLLMIEKSSMVRFRNTCKQVQIRRSRYREVPFHAG